MKAKGNCSNCKHRTSPMFKLAGYNHTHCYHPDAVKAVKSGREDFRHYLMEWFSRCDKWEARRRNAHAATADTSPRNRSAQRTGSTAAKRRIGFASK